MNKNFRWSIIQMFLPLSHAIGVQIYVVIRNAEMPMVITKNYSCETSKISKEDVLEISMNAGCLLFSSFHFDRFKCDTADKYIKCVFF